MAKKVLTSAAMKALRPAAIGRREIPDGGCPGLLLIVQASGHKSWAMRFRRPSGRPAKLTLGVVDLSGMEAAAEPVIGQPLTLASARRLAADINRQRAMGRDVVADHDAARRRQRDAVEEATTFASAGRDFIDQYARPKTRRWQDTARMIGLDPRNDLAPIRGGLAGRWVDRPVADIDGHDIYSVIDEVRRLGVPGLKRHSDRPTDGMARQMSSVLATLFGWLVRHRRVDKNPCVEVHKPESSKARDRVLSAAEIVEFWQAADRERIEFSAALKLLLLTGCRLNEIAEMRRIELGDGGTVLNLPGDRTKNHLPHLVPLAALSRSIMEAVPVNGEFVFSTNGRAPVSSWSRVKRRLDAAMNIPAWRIHDLRRTCATGMAEIGIAPHVVEAVLNHISGARAGVAGVYNRATYLPERKAALDRWADHVEGLVSGRKARIVPIRGRKS